MRDKKYDLAIYIKGPETDKSDYIKGPETDKSDKTEFLAKHADNLVIIGDGSRSIYNSQNQNQNEIYDVLTNLRSKYGEFTGKSLLVYVAAHGSNDQGSHFIETSSYTGTDYSQINMETGYLFELLNKFIGIPMDVIFLPCFGKTAMKYAGILPKNSNILMFSGEKGVSYDIAPEMTEKEFLNQPFSSLELYFDKYLANLHYFQTPIYLTVGKELIDPYLDSNKYYGKTLNEEQKQYVHDHFGNNVCQEDPSCHEKLDKIMDGIAKYSSIDEHLPIRTDYNFLKTFKNLNTKLGFAIFNKSNVDIIDGCKQEIEQLLLDYYHIPFSVNLSDPIWGEFEEEDFIDAAITSEEGYIAMTTLPKWYTLAFLLESGGIQIDECPIFDESLLDYGLALGVAKDLYNYSHEQIDFKIDGDCSEPGDTVFGLALGGANDLENYSYAL